MKRILLSLTIIFIALAGIALVNASSDFNQTVDQDIAYDIDETMLPVDDIAEIDADDDQNATFEPIDNSNETENDDRIAIDNESAPIGNGTQIVIDSRTGKKDLKPVAVSQSQNQSKWKNLFRIDIPDVEVHPTKINTGNKIDDAVVYYSAYYNAFKGVTSNEKSIDALIAVVYQSYDENETIEIVSRIYSMVELQGITGIERTLFDLTVHNYVDNRFNKLYINPNNIKPNYEGLTPPHDNPLGPGNVGPGSWDDSLPWEKNDPKA